MSYIQCKPHFPNYNESLKALIDAIPSGILIIDDQQRVRAMSGVLAHILGVSRQRVVGRPAGEALGCVHAVKGKHGCGSDGYCNDCKVGEAVTAAFQGNQTHRSKAFFEGFNGETASAMELLISSAPLNLEGLKFAVLTVDNIRQLNAMPLQRTRAGFRGIVGSNKMMLELFDTIKVVAHCNVPILLEGESGTGKELVAIAIHKEGPRASNRLVPINCGALPPGLLESEMFGHVKGAFTGALRDKKGRFEVADGGTLFLDEIDELPPSVQVKLLRVLQDGRFERVGSNQRQKVDVRVISATNKNLGEEVAAGRFREDLYYRLCVVPITLPSLRQKSDDIPLLAEYFLAQAAKEWGLEEVALSNQALSVLMKHPWPGNVRELQNVIRYALITCRGKVMEPCHFPPSLRKAANGTPARQPRVRKLHVTAVDDALKKADGNKVKASRMLGVSRATLYRFIAEQRV
jgi:transcriptional regulator with PAS, ATPase and Fis domain